MSAPLHSVQSPPGSPRRKPPPQAVRAYARSPKSQSSGICRLQINWRCSESRRDPRTSSGVRSRSRSCHAIRSNASPIFSASTRLCSYCCRTLTPPTSGSDDRTMRRCLADGPRSIECSRATSRICSSCGNTSTRSAAEFRLHGRLRYPALAVSEVRWQPCFRVISSRFPPIHLFERVAGAEDWEALYWLESLTNPRLRDDVGEIELVPREDRIFGPGASVIMAPFTHLNPEGSRFADDTFGAFYAAASLDTSIAETRYHREIFLRATRRAATRARHADATSVTSRRAFTTFAGSETGCPTSMTLTVTSRRKNSRVA